MPIEVGGFMKHFAMLVIFTLLIVVASQADKKTARRIWCEKHVSGLWSCLHSNMIAARSTNEIHT